LVLIDASTAVTRHLTTSFWLRGFPGWETDLQEAPPATIVMECLRAAFGGYVLLGAPGLRQFALRRMQPVPVVPAGKDEGQVGAG